MNNKPFIASWSGGKDSAMAYYRALQMGGVPNKIWTMFDKDESHSKSHALPLEVVEAQAAQLQVPSIINRADWAGYQDQFLEAMATCVKEGIVHGVFGDIDLEDHRRWVATMCEKVGMKAVHPLWLEPRRNMLEEFVELGFVAYIVVVNTEKMPAKFLGRQFTIELMDELEALGIDSCGELGEFHTVVVDGPIFKEAIPLVFGEVMKRGHHVFQQVRLARREEES